MLESDLKQGDTKIWLGWDAGGGREEEIRCVLLLSHRDDLWKEDGYSSAGGIVLLTHTHVHTRPHSHLNLGTVNNIC